MQETRRGVSLPAMDTRLLRRRRGSPYARSKTLARFARSLSRATPSRQFSNDSQRGKEVATLNAHHEIEQITASATAEAVEDFFLRMDVERRMPL